MVCLEDLLFEALSLSEASPGWEVGLEDSPFAARSLMAVGLWAASPGPVGRYSRLHSESMAQEHSPWVEHFPLEGRTAAKVEEEHSLLVVFLEDPPFVARSLSAASPDLGVVLLAASLGPADKCFLRRSESEEREHSPWVEHFPLVGRSAQVADHLHHQHWG